MSSSKRLQLLLITIPFLITCSVFAGVDPPGVGEKAERGYTVCDPVIAALEQYKTDNGKYPELLEELLPNYLSEIPTEVNDEPISYAITDESYSLAFHYIGPGMNTCAYTPENKWKCSGAY